RARERLDPNRLGQSSGRRHLDLVAGLFLPAGGSVGDHPGRRQILDEGAAEGHVQDLHPATDGEGRHADPVGLEEQLDLEGVAVGLYAVDLRIRLLAVASGIDVAAAAEQQAVDPGEQLRRGGGLAGQQQDGSRAGAPERVEVVLWHAVPTDDPPRHASRHEMVGDDADPGSAHPDTTRTITRAGPWTPRTGVISMSLVRDGPVTRISDEGGVASPRTRSSSRSQSPSNPATSRSSSISTRCLGGSSAVVRCPWAEERSTDPVAATPRIAEVMPSSASASPGGSTAHPPRASPCFTGCARSPSSWRSAPPAPRATDATASASSARRTRRASPPTSTSACKNRSTESSGGTRAPGDHPPPEACVGGRRSGRAVGPSGGAPGGRRPASAPARRSRRTRRNSLRSTGSPPPLPERSLRERRQVAIGRPPRQREGRPPDSPAAGDQPLAEPGDTHRRSVAERGAPQPTPQREPDPLGQARTLGSRVATKGDQELVNGDADRARVGACPAERRGLREVAGALEAIHQRSEHRADRPPVDASVRVSADLPKDGTHVLTRTAPDAVEHRPILGGKHGRAAVVEDHDVKLLGSIRLPGA